MGFLIICFSEFPLLSLIMKRQESSYSLRISLCFYSGHLSGPRLRFFAGILRRKKKIKKSAFAWGIHSRCDNPRTCGQYGIRQRKVIYSFIRGCEKSPKKERFQT